MRRLARFAVALAVACCAATPAFAADAAPVELSVNGIDTSEYPQVSVTVSMPGVTAGSKPEFAISENGRAVEDYRATTTAETVPVRVVLVLDTSGSMQGKAWSDARSAASAFLSALGPQVPVSVLSFDERAVQRVDFTTDRAATMAELAKLEPARETALYDAVVSAVRKLPASGPERRVIVLLSDGGDTVSVTSFNAAMSALKESGIPLYAVALTSKEQNPQALRLLANRSGGRLVSAAQSGELAPAFTGIANEILGTYRVTFTSVRPNTKDVELDLSATTAGARAAAKVAYPNPVYLVPAERSGLAVPDPAEDLLAFAGAVVLAFLAWTLVAYGIARLFFRERNMLSHVKLYDQDAGSRRRRASVTLSATGARLVAFLEPRLESSGLQARFAPLLEAAGMPRRPAEYAVNYLVFAIAGVLVVQAVFGSIVLTLIALVIAAVLPKPILSVLIDRRRRTFEQQLPDTLAMLATAMRGGWTFERAIELAAAEAPEPMCREFGRAVAWLGLGMPVIEVLGNMARRVGSQDFDAVVSGVAVQREVGGNLAEVLDMVSDTMRQREALRRHVRTLTSEARFSAYILIGLPFAILLIMFGTSRSYIVTLFTNPLGIAISVLAALMLAGGSYWIFRLTKVEV